MCLVSVHRDRGLIAFIFSVILIAFIFSTISRKIGLGFVLGISVFGNSIGVGFGFRNLDGFTTRKF